MKKLLLTLLLFFSSIISFGFCISPDYTYNAIEKSFYGGFQNQAYGNDSIFCVDVASFDGNILSVDFMNGRNWNPIYVNHNGYDINSYPYNFCFFVPSDIPGIVGSINGNFSNITFKAFQFVVGGGGGGGSNNCVGSVCEINFYDSYNQSTSQYTYNISDGGIQSINISYNSKYDGFQTINGDFAISPLQNTLDCPGKLNICQSNLSTMSGNWNSCKTAYNTLSGNYNSCLSDLSNCQNSNNCSSIESAYSGCVSDLSIMSGNYNSCLGELNSCINGSVSTGDIQWSALYINNIQHLGKPIITIDIPEEISWDYVSTGDSFNLDINGYNVDSDYIEGIINLQNTTPTNEDFNKLVSEVVPLLVPGLFIIAFLYFVFRFIKKVF